MSAKLYDVVVFGATGFTGRLVARHLVTEPETALGSPGTLKWAIAARSADKLASLKTQLKSEIPQVDAALIDTIPVIIADSKDESSLRRMAEQTKVVISLVGPYRLYGELLVRVCAELGVHYCDLTGEVLWARNMMQKYASVAAASGAILVHSCGVDSVPSDLGVYLLAKHIRETRGEPTGKVDFLLTDFVGSVSGGTLASMFQMVEGRTAAEMKETVNPFVLTDDATIQQKQSSGLVARNTPVLKVQYCKPLGIWSSMFLGGLIDQAIVHRSNFLLDNLYGKNFVYSERLAKGGWLMQLAVTAGSLTLAAMLYFDWTRKLLQKLVPGPGEGASESAMRRGYYVVDALGYTEDGALGAKLKVVGDGDPGYLMTMRIISECAFCLAKGDLRGSGKAVAGGFYTPVSAFGELLIERLHRKKFMTFDVEDVAPPSTAAIAF